MTRETVLVEAAPRLGALWQPRPSHACWIAFAAWFWVIGFELRNSLVSHGRLGFRQIGEIYFANTVTMPAVVLVTSVVAFFFECRRGSDRRIALPSTCIALAFAAFSLRVYATHIEPFWLKVQHERIVSDKVDRPLRIVHVSDVQSSAVGSYEERVIQTIREAKPDLVVLTGDMLTPLPPRNYQTETGRMFALWDTVRPPLGKFVVEGDVDRAILKDLRAGAGGLQLLQSGDAVVTAGNCSIRLMGLDVKESRGTTSVIERVSKWRKVASPGDLTVLAGHAPDYILSMNELPIDLCLAGHCHGGQIRLPFYGPLKTLSRIPRNLAKGLHSIGNTRINVSGGVGCEHASGLPCIRLNCRPEFTVLDIVPR